MSSGTIRVYTPEFRRQAVNLAKTIGPKEASRKLGISEQNIYNWQRKPAKETLTAPEDPKAMAEELKRLRAKVSELEKVNVILKRAAAFFSRDHLE